MCATTTVYNTQSISQYWCNSFNIFYFFYIWNFKNLHTHSHTHTWNVNFIIRNICLCHLNGWMIQWLNCLIGINLVWQFWNQIICFQQQTEKLLQQQVIRCENFFHIFSWLNTKQINYRWQQSTTDENDVVKICFQRFSFLFCCYCCCCSVCFDWINRRLLLKLFDNVKLNWIEHKQTNKKIEWKSN